MSIVESEATDSASDSRSSFGIGRCETTDLLSTVRAIVDHDLVAQAATIDREGLYPEQTLRRLGAVGAYRQHLSGRSSTGEVDIALATEIQAVVAEKCLTTAFCMWCQNACGWYLENTGNDNLRKAFRNAVGDADILGGTGLSNPMKYRSGIEPLRLQGNRVDGGYVVRGRVSFVSNLGKDHVFGAVFGDNDQQVMALLSCDTKELKGRQNAHFCALEGTRTWTMTLSDVFVPDERIIAAPADEFLRTIRPGFILLQVGLGIGIMRDAAREMHELDNSLGHVNRYLEVQPCEIAASAVELNETLRELAASPRETAKDYVDSVRRLRLNAANGAMKAAHGALLHAGARGYLRDARAQRRLREAYFIGILTPATKHLNKDIASSTNLS